MNNKYLYFVFLIFVSKFAFGQDYDSTYGKPIIFLIEKNPWAMIDGTDVPIFVMYENGQIIFQRNENRILKLYQITLNKNELLEVIRSLSISDSIYQLPSYIDGSSNEDESSNELILNFDSLKIITVYGNLSDKSRLRTNIPKLFLSVYDNIREFNCDSAKEWFPNKIEIVFWDYNSAHETRAWLSGFPDLNSSGTKILDDGKYNLYIDGNDFPKFAIYYSSMGENQAVLINGKKMAMAYRVPFPNFRWY